MNIFLQIIDTIYELLLNPIFMKKFNVFRNAFLKNLLFLKLKAAVLSPFVLLCCSNMIVAQNSKVPSMESSWGVRLIMQAGSALDNAIDNLNYDYVEYARQINQNYPTAGHVITNLSSNANGANYTMRTNAYVNLAQVDNTMVPSAASQQVFLNTISELRSAGKEVILYFNYTNNMYRGTASQQANWDSFVNSNYGGDYFDAFEDLIAGYVSELAGLVDGYWVDNFAQGTNVQKTAFINRLRAEDPNAFFGVNVGKAYFADQVDSDGVGDSDPTDYSVIKFDATNVWSDFTAGHITPISQKAPPNSWGYEEFTITDMVDDNLTSFGSETNILKHMFTPIRERWTSSALPLQFTDQDQAYRFVKRIVDAGGAITFSTTTSTTGLPMPDEVAILSYVNDQLEINADYVPYVRPAGAFLVGETTPNYNQFIDFPALPDKDVNDANFDPGAAASSGATVSYTSSNTSVATIVGGNISIQGAGTTTITASQGGNGTFAAATNVSRQLTVTGSSGGTNIALGGTASQSTTLSGAVASRAIDGNTNGNFSAGSVSAAQGPNAWWEVDLGGTYSIDDINIFNRTNSCCINRLSNFTVLVINGGTTTFSQTITSTPTPSETIDAGGAVGQVVRIESNLTSTLNLAEVEVFGTVSSGGAFVPDSSKTYYIDCPQHNLRLAANGSSDDPYTTSTTTTGSDVEWKFVDNGNGYWHIDRAAGGAQPRLRSDGTADADMNQPGTSANTYYEFSEGNSNGTYFLTLPNGPVNYNRLQINSSGEVKMTGTSSTGSWVSFTITEASCPNFSTIEAEGFNAMLGIVNEGSNIGYIEDGDWAMFSDIDLTCASSIDISASSNTNGGTVEVRLGSPTGTLIGTVPISGTGNWGTYTIFDSSINNVGGTHNVYLVFNGGSGYLFNIDWIEFSGGGQQQSTLKSAATITLGEPIADDVQNNFIVYPNPAANSVTIDFKSTGTAKMEIIDSLGGTILSGDIENGTETVDLSGLSSGMYIIKVSDGAETFTKKVIKK